MRRTQRSIRTATVHTALVSALAFAGLALPASVAVAEPETARVVSAVDIDSRRQLVTVFSPAMRKPIPVQVIRAADTENPRPTMYLLNGSQGGPNQSGWDSQTDAVSFLRDKDVNVVTPISIVVVDTS